jgi:hypothetical protein
MRERVKQLQFQRKRGSTRQETLLPLLGDNSNAYILQGRQYRTITSLSRTKEVESYNMCMRNNKKCSINEVIRGNNEAAVRWRYEINNGLV